MDKSEKMLERVRALLAKADSTTFPEEAETFRQKADQLMAEYAIEQWQVEAAQNGVGAGARPEKRMMDFGWWYESSHSSDLWSMFFEVAHHCRVVIATRGHGESGNYREIPVIGLKSDIQYFDLLFTHLMLQMGKELEPHVEPDESLGANVYRLRQAGQPWPRITQQVYEAGLVSLTKGEMKKLRAYRERMGLADIEWEEDVKWSDLGFDEHWSPVEVSMSVKNRLANANRKFVKDNDLQAERNYVKPAVFQRSFAYGFVQQIGRRLRAMDERNRSAYDAGHKAGSMDLVVRDIYDQAVALYEELFPKPEPVAGTGKRRRGRAVTRSVVYSGDAIDSGRAAGERANLSVKPGKGVGGAEGGLPKGS
jgi:hypothetical protein